MANPLKVLTALSASYGAAVSGSDGLKVQQGGVTINGGDLRLNNNAIKASDGNTSITLNSTSAKVEGDLTVGSGHFKVGSNVESLIADTTTGYIAAQAGFAVTGSTTTSGSLTVNGNGTLTANNGATVNGSTLTANAGVVVNSSALLVDGGGISGSSTLQIGGVATFGNNVTIAGDLTVNGTKTVVNTTDLLITDKKVVIASGSSTAATATTAGIYLGNDTTPVASLQYVSSSLGATGHAWTSSENINLSSGKSLQLNGTSAVSKNTGVAADSDLHVLTNSTYGSLVAGNVGATFAAVAGLKAGAGATVSGSSYVFVKAPDIILSGTTSTSVSNAFNVLGTSTLQTVNATTVSASVAVSASVFVLADGTQLTSSTQLGGGGGGGGDATKTGVESAYNTVRFVTSSVLDGNGYIEVDLTTGGGSKFASANLNKISIDVLTRPSGDSGYWNNDLVSVKLENSASALWVKIDAPASPNASYRLVAINESDFDVV